MLTNRLFCSVDGAVKGQRLVDTPSVFDGVVAEFPSKTLGPFYASNRPPLVSLSCDFDGGCPPDSGTVYLTMG